MLLSHPILSMAGTQPLGCPCEPDVDSWGGFDHVGLMLPSDSTSMGRIMVPACPAEDKNPCDVQDMAQVLLEMQWDNPIIREEGSSGPSSVCSTDAATTHHPELSTALQSPTLLLCLISMYSVVVSAKQRSASVLPYNRLSAVLAPWLMSA